MHRFTLVRARWVRADECARAALSNPPSTHDSLAQPADPETPLPALDLDIYLGTPPRRHLPTTTSGDEEEEDLLVVYVFDPEPMCVWVIFGGV